MPDDTTPSASPGPGPVTDAAADAGSASAPSPSGSAAAASGSPAGPSGAASGPRPSGSPRLSLNPPRKASVAPSAASKAGARPHPVPAPKAPASPVSEEARTRGRVAGLAAIGAAAVVAIVVTVGIFVPAIGTVLTGADAPVDAAALPAQVLVCDREYDRSPSGLETLETVRARLGTEPVVAGVKGGCPSGVCVTNGACLDVVFVRTTDDRYQQYELADTSA